MERMSSTLEKEETEENGMRKGRACMTLEMRLGDADESKWGRERERERLGRTGREKFKLTQAEGGIRKASAAEGKEAARKEMRGGQRCIHCFC